MTHRSRTLTSAVTALGLLGVVAASPALASAEAPAPARSVVETDTQTIPLAGVDAAALAQLRGDLAAGKRVAPGPATLAVDPEATQTPDVLTAPTEVDDFTVAAVTWSTEDAAADVTVDVSVREAGGWSPWERLETETPSQEDDLATVDAFGTEPLLTGGADAVQVRVDASDPAVVDSLRLVLVDGGSSPRDAQVRASAAAAPTDAAATEGTVSAQASAPRIVTRAQWGADDRKLNGSTSTNSTVRAMTIHHTASTNNYSASSAMSQLRGIYAYHTDSLGWADVGYNFLVDKAGVLYEGRKGSITRAVRGAHASGFNTNTMGISAMGNYEATSAPSAMVDAMGRLVGWKLSQYGVTNPKGSVTLTSSGGTTTRYAAGRSVTLPRIFGHRQTSYTTCPGQYLYSRLDRIGDVAASVAGSPTPAPSPAPTPAPAPAPTPEVPVTGLGGNGGTPLAADVDGDGKEELGWFRDGQFAFQADGGAVRTSLGRPGDTPVTGDWDRDGKDEIGVWRAGVWYLRNSLSSTTTEKGFRFGRAGDIPLVGRWAGQSQDGIGLFRDGRWLTRRTVTPGSTEHWFDYGRPTDQPVLGSWLSDGVARPGVVRGNHWYLSTSIKNPRSVWNFVFGRTTDTALVSDRGGDGVQTATVVRGTTFYTVRGHARTPGVDKVSFAG